ncbi:DNA-binding protein [Micromonospora globispora]|uniref:DNA-binding protein n=1 Tax=Micromonospora globispora TaxID=1450148 RepID=A0A317K6F4_9ACTN|nr:helix-turn-helix transcriptional regulator [Micromonospora globispora]PWU46713.1 DNA-binding protein [Micromonospora globispora]PWU61996.1 DNA-binding protein [Micromonospora globispora]
MDDLGAQLRQARTEAGITLASVAARSCYSASHLSNVEAGRRAATPDIVLVYARALGEGDVNRRQVLGLAAGVLGPVVAGELIRVGFSAALNGRGAEEDWRERVDQYGRDYMAVGAALLQARLASDLVILQQHLDTPHMWSHAARALVTYGKTTSHPAEAIRWYDLAASAADRSDDLGVRVWVRGRAAIALAYEGAALPTARRYADQAITLSDRPSLGRVQALMALAHAAAGRGNQAGAVGLDTEARRVFDHVASPDDEVSDTAVPPWRMATFRSMLYARLGMPGPGVEAQEEADRTRPAGLPRFATHIELHRGLTVAKAGDKAGGVAYARRAWNALPAERRSQSLALMLREVERA